MPRRSAAGRGAGGALSASATAIAEELEQEGRTAVLVERDGAPVGLLGIADRSGPRPATFKESPAGRRGSLAEELRWVSP
jgi:hypothetical protein